MPHVVEHYRILNCKPLHDYYASSRTSTIDALEIPDLVLVSTSLSRWQERLALHVGEVLFWGAKEYGSVCPDDVNATGLFLVSFLK
jgi:hypothetical protein